MQSLPNDAVGSIVGISVNYAFDTFRAGREAANSRRWHEPGIPWMLEDSLFKVLGLVSRQFREACEVHDRRTRGFGSMGEAKHLVSIDRARRSMDYITGCRGLMMLCNCPQSSSAGMCYLGFDYADVFEPYEKCTCQECTGEIPRLGLGFEF